MLRARDGATRERKSLDGIWAFALDPDGRGRDTGWWQGPLPDARDMPVPASYNDIVPDPAVRDYIGDVWYQTQAWVPSGWDGQRIVLRFDAATHRAVVWVGETQVAEHEGGYTPFEADVTDLVEPGRQIRITAVVGNVLTWQSIPPGVVEETAAGPRQIYWHDFFNYAGLHRSVWLYSTPKAHISDVTVVTGLEGSSGWAQYSVEAQNLMTDGNADGFDVRVRLLDAQQEQVAEARGSDGRLDVPDVHPWQPGEGYLYDLVVELRDGDAVADSYRLPVGIRTVEVRGTEFLINGKPFYFTGFGMHEDHPVVGKGNDEALFVHDFELLAWIGACSTPSTPSWGSTCGTSPTSRRSPV